MGRYGRKVRPGRKHRLDAAGLSDAPEPPIILDYANALATAQYRFFDRIVAGALLNFYIEGVTSCDLVDGGANPTDTITMQVKGGSPGNYYDVMRGLMEIPLPDIVMLAGSVFLKCTKNEDYHNQAVCICNYLGGASHITSDWEAGVGMPAIPATLLSDQVHDLGTFSPGDWLEFPLNDAGITELQAAQNGTFRFVVQSTDMAYATEPSVWTENKMEFHIQTPQAVEALRPYVRYGYVA